MRIARLSGCTDDAALSRRPGECHSQRPLGIWMQETMDDDLIMWPAKDLVS